MRLLPASIGKAGFELTLIRRKGRAAIYRQHLPGGNPNHDAYEVILAQSRDTNHEGQPAEPYEAYPAAESWGQKGGTVTSLDKAIEKLIELTRNGSRTRTVSRRNRFEGDASSRTRLVPKRARSVVVEDDLIAVPEMPLSASRARNLKRFSNRMSSLATT